MEILFIKLLACHFIGDFAFQSPWLAEGKGKSWEINLYHALTYTAPFCFINILSWQGLLYLAITHFFIDPLKARYKIIKYVWADQLLHLLVLVLVKLFLTN